MIQSRRIATVVSVAMLMAGTGMVGTAAADQVGAPNPNKNAVAQPQVLQCGAQVSRSTKLTANIGPCSSTDGIDIVANGVTLDLNGKHVFAVNATGDVAGVRLLNVSGVRVANGTVDGFNDGVAIFGGSRNTITKVNATNNISDYGGGTGPVCDLGDGIGIFGSSNNSIIANVVNHNGPYGGISVVNASLGSPTVGGLPVAASSSGNQIIGNQTNNNDVTAPSPTPRCLNNPQQDEGIRIEGPNTSNNNIVGNTVSGNILAGIGIHSANNIFSNDMANKNNTIVGNIVTHNGQNSAADIQSGISILGTPGVASFGNTIRGNLSTDNAADGIAVPARSHDNVITGNTVKSNGKDGIYLAGPNFSNVFTNVGPTLVQLVTPPQPAFSQGSDYVVISGSDSGDVTANLVPVGPITIPPVGYNTAASGCLPSDWAGFPSGAVALVQNGYCGLSFKVLNAMNAGASGIVIFNEGSPGRTGVVTASVVIPTTIPVIGTTYALGQQLYNLTQAGPMTIHIVTNTTNVSSQTPGAENNTVSGNMGRSDTEFDGNDQTVTPPCDHNRWAGNSFGTVNQACVATHGAGTVTP